MGVRPIGRRPFRLRALLYLYSNANIAGCALALAGPALLFADLIGPGWLAITAGLYAAGWLLGRRPPELERHIEASLGAEQMLAKLDELIARARPHLSGEHLVHLGQVRVSVAEVLPRLVAGGAGGGDSQLFTVRETVLNYLPETLANYVALPPMFRTNHVLKDGKTAHALLTEQLGVLSSQLAEVVAHLAASDAQALLANGRFLQARFNQPDFLADAR
jgi:hypothetical protein